MKSSKNKFFTKEDMLLYAVTDRHWLDGRSLSYDVRQSLEGGVTFLQLREKELDYQDFLKEAMELKKLCAEFNVPFVINDNVELAIECDADGVHVGQSDMEAGNVREKIGPDKILGVSAQTVDQAILAEKQGADYLGVGAVFPTGSKDDADDVSHETLKAICDAVSIPVVAIGGISMENVSELAGTDIDGVAVISAIYAQNDIRDASLRLKEKTKMALESHKITGAIFDMDGVVLDSLIIWNELGTRYLRKYGIEATHDMEEKLFSMSLREGIRYIKSIYDIPQGEEEIREEFHDMLRDFYYNQVLEKEGIGDIIRLFKEKGLPIACATASPRDHITKALERNGLYDLFDVFLTTDEVGKGKHDPDIYLEASEIMGTVSGETLVFEDSLYCVETAKAAGFITIGVNDIRGERNQAGLRRESDFYLTELKEFDKLKKGFGLE